MTPTSPPVPLYAPDPEFVPEKVQYVDGFGAKIVRIAEDDEDNRDGDWGGWFGFSWKKSENRTASGRLKWEDERDTWF